VKAAFVAASLLLLGGSSFAADEAVAPRRFQFLPKIVQLNWLTSSRNAFTHFSGWTMPRGEVQCSGLKVNVPGHCHSQRPRKSTQPWRSSCHG
jgi:hypothetical protein